jgi:hypothetical protein
MRKGRSKPIFFPLLGIVLFFVVVSCANKPMLIGKWREMGKIATIEFLEDGSFKAMDNMGMAVSGKYSLLENGNIRFEIAGQGTSKEIIEGEFSMQKDELVISFGNGKEVERYGRVKP